MSKTKKIVIATVGIIALIGAGMYGYVVNVATGNAPDWNPADYREIDANGMTFAVDIQGKTTDTPVILLHGFPEAAVMWEPLMPKLVAQGFYAIAPNQRGYSAAARPTEIAAYTLDILAADVLALADQLNLLQFHLIGHDWGAGVGWKLAADHPDRILSYAAISVPHIDAFGDAYRNDQAQYEASDYMRFFQQAIVPEFVLAKDDYASLRAVWDQHEQAEIDEYLRILSQENALTAALNWYRANVPVFEAGLTIGEVQVPTTFIWGNQDQALKRAGVAGTAAMVKADYTFIEMDAGHWIIQQQPEQLMTHLMAHLAKYR